MLLLLSYCQKSHLGDEICLYYTHSNITIAQVPHRGVCLFLWFVLQITSTFYIVLWDQTDDKEPSVTLVCSLSDLKSVKRNRAKQQRVIVASVHVSSKHTQLILQYPNHKGIKGIKYSLMANVMRWNTLWQTQSPFLLLI